MDSAEVKKELGMGYAELVEYLLKKYGAAKGDYFVSESCKTKNRNVPRTSEGLECHHIDEDKAIMLSDSRWAVKNPFSYQKADRLVYCNVLEHLILHVKIVEGPRNMEANPMEIPGLGGIMNYLCPQINDYYNGYEYKRPYEVKKFELISDNYDDYIEVLRHFLDIVTADPSYILYVTPQKLSRGYSGEIIEKIYRDLF